MNTMIIIKAAALWAASLVLGLLVGPKMPMVGMALCVMSAIGLAWTVVVRPLLGTRAGIQAADWLEPRYQMFRMRVTRLGGLPAVVVGVAVLVAVIAFGMKLMPILFGLGATVLVQLIILELLPGGRAPRGAGEWIVFIGMIPVTAWFIGLGLSFTPGWVGVLAMAAGVALWFGKRTVAGHGAVFRPERREP